MDFIVSLVDSLSWPISIFLLVLILRRPIVQLLERTASIRWGDKRIEFDNSLTDVRENVDRTFQESSDIGLDPSSNQQALDSLHKAFEYRSKHPRRAIIEAWLEVEEALDAAIERLELYESYSKHRNAGLAIRLLRSAEQLRGEWVEALKGLRRLRNKAAHDRHFDLEPDQAEEYIQLCVDVITYISKLGTAR
ncbi:MAG: hypothetical protein OXQ86_00245 [Gammaproteobacteria bacterium]|nr:hypothetical protein [Gammaproteobacteria bacterium]MDE0415046.1 hypothetical protein [Gammaproteobacteria bacterium]